MIYLDNNATTRPLPEVTQTVERTMREHWHNPSSVHRPGQEARQCVELARRSLSRLIGSTTHELVLSSGGTESINLAIRGSLASARRAKRNVIVTTAIEHAAVRELLAQLERAGEAESRLASIDDEGVICLDQFKALLGDDVALVSVQWANNETGVIQPIAELGAICRARRIPMHVDAAQWVGKMPANVADLPIDLLSFSAHKFHGPKGVGGLYCRRGVPISPEAPGAQELGRRAGTENVAGIAGAGAAAEAALTWLEDEPERDRIAALRDQFEEGVLRVAPVAHINRAALRLWNTTNIGFPSLEAEALLMLLSERGVCASAGAACSSGSLEPSPVLLAMGIPESIAHGSVRFSLSRETTQPDIEEAVEIVGECAKRLRSSSASLG